MKNEVFIDTGIPAWMEPPKRSSTPPFSRNTWEEILDRMAAGEFLKNICEEPNMPEYGFLLRFIHANEAYRDEYYTAREAGGVHHADMVRKHAEGGETDGVPNEVQRDQLIVNAHKWCAGVFNRKKFGDKQQVEVTHSVDLSEAMQRAQQRLEQRPQPLLIEGEVVDD